MIRASNIKLAGTWDAERADDRLVLNYEARWRRRQRLTSWAGLDLLLDLPQTVVMREGDGLVLEDGRIALICAADEKLLAVTAHGPQELARIAWHLGNRHTPAAIEAGRILVQPDHVLADMLRGLGADVSEILAPFNPERGAYAVKANDHSHTHHHHAHGHDHDHDH